MGRMGPLTRFALEDDIKRALEAFPPIWVPPTERAPYYLTEAELQVLKLLRLGMTNQEIGDALYISPLTVRTHVKRIHSKCDVKGRARLAVTAFTIWDRGLWVEPGEKRQAVVAGMRAKRKAQAEMVA